MDARVAGFLISKINKDYKTGEGHKQDDVLTTDTCK
jgi:hypothetical protein